MAAIFERRLAATDVDDSVVKIAAAGAAFLDAETMWIQRGAAPMSWAFDHPFDADPLRG